MSGAVLGWASLAIVVVAVAVWFRKALALEVQGSRAAYVSAWAAGAALGVVALTREPGLAGGIAAGFSVALGAMLLGLVAISPQKVAADAVRVGSKLPDFAAVTDDEEPFTLSGLEGRPILLKFFRGHW